MGRLIEHGLWPICTFIILLTIIIRGELRQILNSVQSLKVGNFSLTTKIDAEAIGVLDELKILKSLTLSQLHLYIVLGGEGGDSSEYKSKINQIESKMAFKKLSELGLIEFEEKNGATHFGNTEKGMKLHKIIMDNLYKSLNV